MQNQKLGLALRVIGFIGGVSLIANGVINMPKRVQLI